MNEILKQRIVGALVITALAAIFVPMLFDDPITDADNFTNELSLPENPAVDMQPLLDDIPKTPAQILSKPVLVPIDLQQEPDDAPKTAKAIVSVPAPSNTVPVTSKTTPAQANIQRKSVKQANKTTNLKSWTIQVGSFSQKQNAIEFRDKLRKNKFTAYVDSVKTKNGTLYRLRVGPELDKKRALKTKQQVEAKYKIKTLLVAK